MIAFYLLLLITIVSLVVMIFSRRRCRRISFATLFIAIILLGFWTFSAIENVSNRTAATEKYNALILYKEAVENSNNEAMRFDYHNRVEDWNASYYNAKNIAENPWLNWMILTDMNLSEVNTIKFELRK